MHVFYSYIIVDSCIFLMTLTASFLKVLFVKLGKGHTNFKSACLKTRDIKFKKFHKYF